MAHRGRLNMLANIVGKKYSQIFREFEGNIDPRTVQGSGDVKYHLGAEGEFIAGSGDQIKVSVAANPSHLEAVDPVLEGIARAKQDMLDRGAEYPVLPLLVHGDAAFAGQGVVAETLNLSQLRGYRTGGTIHVVVNNQVGFTTSPGSSRSSLYCTDVARMVQAPIFHVNGDDPEACIRVARLAFEYRQAFNKDVVIDLVCYRRRGHNEGDDPSYTQPLMYDLIEQKRSVRKLYTESLIGRGDITIEEAEQVLGDYQQQLERVFTEVREADSQPSEWTTVPTTPRSPSARRPTAISAEVMKRIADAYVTPPDGFTVHPKVMPQLQRRPQSIADGPIDWGTGEILAFGALLMEGRPVRLAGQDSRRGTFVSRFATIIDRVNADEWTPLSNLSEDQAKFHVYDSLLVGVRRPGVRVRLLRGPARRAGAVGGQFGDFVNGAQTIIDEFISSGETKWSQQSGVVLLLPHGYEGQGPDHSSARIERFLQLCAEGSMAVAQPSTPAYYFHLLRRHCSARAPPAGGVHAEVDAQAQGSRLAARGLHQRDVPADHRRRRAEPYRSRRCCSARAGSPGTSWPSGTSARTTRVRHRPGRGALPLAGRRDQGRDRPVPDLKRALGAGRAGQHGPVAAYALTVWPHVGHVRADQRPALSSPVRRHRQAARRGAEVADRVRLRGTEDLAGTDERHATEDRWATRVLHRPRHRGAPATPW